MASASKRLSWAQWLKIVPEIKDISDELPDAFLMIGQIMRAKILWNGEKWYASGWHIDRKPYVTLEKVGQ